MLRWKNKPINDLSDSELRIALTESMTLLLNSSGEDESHKIFQAFVTGVFIGLSVAGMATLITSLL